MKQLKKGALAALVALGVLAPAAAFGEKLPAKPVEGEAHGHLHFFVDIPSEYEVRNEKGEIVEEVSVEIHATMTVGPKQDHQDK